jgi:MFS family permease
MADAPVATERRTEQQAASYRERPSQAHGPWQRLGNTFSSLSVRDFRYLWLGSFASQIGMWVQQVAMGWLAYDLTGSATYLGVVATARSISSVALTLPAGVAADRWDRKTIILISQIGTFLQAATLAVLVSSGNIQAWHLAVASFVLGGTHALNMPARQSLAPQLAGQQHIANAVALNSISFNTSRVLGPSIAGILVWVAGLALCFQIKAVLMLGSILLTLAIRGDGSGQGTRSTGSLWSNLVDGVTYVRGTVPVRAVFLMACVPILIGSIYNQFMPVFARDVLEIGPSGMGALMSAVGFGSMVGSFTLAALSHHPRKGLIMIGMGVASGVALCAFALSQWFVVSLVTLAAVGFSLVMCLSLGQTLLNLLVPNEYRGRVMSIWSMIWSLEAITILPAGWLTDQAGAPVTIFICGLFVLAFFVLMASRKGVVRDYEDRSSAGAGHRIG